MLISAVTLQPDTHVPLCNKCDANLPTGSQFCLKCGEPVLAKTAESTERIRPAVPSVDPQAVSLPHPRPPRQRRTVLWLLLLVLLGVLAWAVLSTHPYALQFQESVGLSHALAVTDSNFTVAPHNFTSYKFIVPAGAGDVVITGQFNVVGSSSAADSGVEAYVLTDSAFAIWQNGYATSNHYESGRVSEATVKAQLPGGAGVYYFVVSNKFAPRAAKTVNANLLLHYKSWLPEWLRLAKDRFWNWVGL